MAQTEEKLPAVQKVLLGSAVLHKDILVIPWNTKVLRMLYVMAIEDVFFLSKILLFSAG